jgi:hypothetical protein
VNVIGAVSPILVGDGVADTGADDEGDVDALGVDVAAAAAAAMFVDEDFLVSAAAAAVTAAATDESRLAGLRTKLEYLNCW